MNLKSQIPNPKSPSGTKLVIVGGVAGGATAAARARRLNEFAQITLFERGEYVSFANCGLPYYIGGVIKDRDELLLMTPAGFKARYNVNVRNFCEVTAVDRLNRQVMVRDLSTGETFQEPYDKLILSPGAEPFRPPLEGMDSDRIFTLRNIPDTDRIKAFVDRENPESAVVVGAGFIGLEMAENFVLRGIRTTVIEMLDQVMAPLDPEMALMVREHLLEKGVNCELETGVQGFTPDGEKLVVHTTRGQSIPCDLVLMSAGIRPEHRLAREAGLALGERGGIRVNAAMQTSDSDIYAVGDAVEVMDRITGRPTLTPLAGPANKQARIAADNALGRRSVFKGTLGTAVVKVFDLTVASTGANEKTLQNQGILYRVAYTHSGSHAGYYPDAQMLSIKLLFTPGDGKVLGAQIIGPKGVDKRIDVLATAIHGGMTVFDLEELELSYAPPFSSAKDPVNIAGFVAANLIKGDVTDIPWPDMARLDPERDVLLDLREKIELEEVGRIDGALHVPLWRLRKTLPKLDKAKHYITFCAVGMRSYVAYRILVQHGFQASLFSGGYSTYSHVREKIAAMSKR